jgi:hypothetical protein
METTPVLAASTTASHKLAKLAAGLFLGGLMLSATLQSAGAAEVAPKALRHAQVVALSSVVLNRLNTIRSSFGLGAGSSSSAYSSEVGQAVSENEDPPVAPATGGVVGEEGLWGMIPGATSATATAAAVEIVNGWVYHDGWQGSVAATWNADCTSAHAAGCNAHRRNVLSTPPVAGATLSIDVTTKSVTYDGQPAIAVAALFVWKTA